MNSRSLTVVVIFVAALVMGCSGGNANIKTQSEDQSKLTQEDLFNNWSDYNIRYNSVVIVFDPKNDDKKIFVDNYWSAVKDQETWTQMIKGTEIKNNRDIQYIWENGVREIWVLDNQFYGYVIHQPRELVSAKSVDDNTVRLIHNYAVYGGP